MIIRNVGSKFPSYLLSLLINLNSIMKERMDQAEIDALLKDSMFEDSQIRQSQQINHTKQSEADSYGNDQFESYQESRPTVKNQSKTQLNESKRLPKKKLQAIKEQSIPFKQEKTPKQGEAKLPKTGIYFQQKKQRNSNSQERRTPNLPYNYARISQRQRQLLLTSITQQNLQLKQILKNKDNDYKKLDAAYKALLKEKSQNAPSVREITLEKQLASMNSKYEKLQEILKMEKTKTNFKSTKSQGQFVPQTIANQRQEQLCHIIEQLRERLLATTNELKTLQGKMNEGENYVEELRRKLRRIQQLQFKMEKMTEQAENDRTFIEVLKDKNRKLDDRINEMQREKKMLEIEVHRLRLGDSTQKDCFKELEDIRRQKDLLERNLRELTSNLMGKMRVSYKQTNRIEDSGQLLKP